MPVGPTKRRRILRRAKHHCFICHHHIKKASDWEVHHVVPRSEGGTNDFHNLKPVHRVCHHKHHGMNPEGTGASQRRALDENAE